MNRNLLILGAIVIGLGGFLFFDVKSDRQKEEKKMIELNLLDKPQEQYKKIILKNKYGEIELEKTVDGWKIIRPIQDWANSDFVDSYLKEMKADVALEKSVKDDPKPEQLETYGMNSPVGELIIKTNLDEATTLQLASKNNFEANPYLKKVGVNGLFTVGSSWIGRFNKSLMDFRERKYYRQRLATLDRVQISYQKNQLNLVRNENEWSLEKDTKTKLDQARIRELLTQITDSQIEEYQKEGNQVLAADEKTFADSEAVKFEMKSGDKIWKGAMKVISGKVIAFSSEPKFIGRLSLSHLNNWKSLNASKLIDTRDHFEFNLDEVKKVIYKETGVSKEYKEGDKNWLEVKTALGKIRDARAKQLLTEQEVKQNASLGIKKIEMGSLELYKQDQSLIKRLTWYHPFELKKANDLSEKLLPMVSSYDQNSLMGMDATIIEQWKIRELGQ